MKRPIILACDSTLELAERVRYLLSTKLYTGEHFYEAEKKDPEVYNLEIDRFADTEFAPVLPGPVRRRDVYILLHNNSKMENVVRLGLTIQACRLAEAGQIIVVIPYLPMARQDKTGNKRTSLGAKWMANMIEMSGADSVICLDLHADQIQGFFNIPCAMVYGRIIFRDYIQNLGLDMDNVVFGSPDAGGVKRAEAFASMFQKEETVMLNKTRPKANEVGRMYLIGEVKGLDVILVDDIIDTAGTIVKATKILYENGAKSVRAIGTHAVMSGEANNNISGSLLSELIVSNTIPLKEGNSKITVVDIAPALANILYRHLTSESISELNH